MKEAYETISIVHKPRLIRRASYSTQLLTSAAVQVAPPNPKRIGIVVGTTPFLPSGMPPTLTVANAVDLSVTGVALSVSIGGAFVGYLDAASFQITTGTGVVVALQRNVGGLITTIQQYTNQGFNTGKIAWGGGQAFQWNVLTAVAGAIGDFSISDTLLTNPVWAAIDWNKSVISTTGLMIPAGGAPVNLWKDVIGDALTGELYAIGSNSGITMTIWDLFQ